MHNDRAFTLIFTVLVVRVHHVLTPSFKLLSLKGRKDITTVLKFMNKDMHNAHALRD